MNNTTKKERTNGVIYGEAGQIKGLLPICPHCGQVKHHQGVGGSVNIWTVGSVQLMECTKCRKRHKTITLTVPPEMEPEDFYLQISSLC